jgi:hypothetical protein
MQLDLFRLPKEKSSFDTCCIKCKELLPPKAFGNASGGKYKNTTCKKCSQHNARVIRTLHETTARPPEDHACPVCLRTKEALVSPKKPNKSVWSLDHHHKGGYFRGWLCHRCNRGVGLIGDSVENANRLVDYLNER